MHPSPSRRRAVKSVWYESTMPANQRNWGYYTYVSGDGTTYNIRADQEWAAVSAHGLAARASGQPRYIATGRRKPRMAKYVDLTTGRSRQGPIGTSSAWDALATGATQGFAISSETAAVTYTLASKMPEKVPGSVIASSLPDHA